MRVGVTGTVDVNGDSIDIVMRAIHTLDKEKVTEFTTGGAFGVDSIAAQLADYYFSKNTLKRVSFPKGYWFNKETLKWADEIDPVDGGYLVRNDRIIFFSDVLFAFPKTPVEQKRSGTWSTVRRARKKGIPIFYFPLNGADPWQENLE